MAYVRQVKWLAVPAGTARVGFALALAIWLAQAGSPAPRDPLAIFTPDVTLSRKDYQSLDAGDPVVRVLPGKNREMAVFVAVAVDADGDRLVSWVDQIEQLRKSRYVGAIRRFSSPPRLEDLASLSLDDHDLDAIRGCRPGGCDLKLSTAEIARLQAIIARSPTEWKPAVQDEFRQIVLDRVDRYLLDGSAGVGPYNDKNPPVSPSASFSAIVGQATSLTTHLPDFAAFLAEYPHAPAPSVESFLYWSKDLLGGKPQVSVTHVAVIRGRDRNPPFDVLMAGKQVFGIHYTDGSLSLTALVSDPSTGRRYLAYENRTEVDMLGGFFGGLMRLFAERRLKSEAPGVLRDLRQRLESGEPPR